MTAMTSPQIDAFLHDIRHAIVATQRRDGTAQLSSVWYLYENGLLYFSISLDTAKYHNLHRDPRLSVCVDGGHGDARTVVLYGTAQIIEPGQPKQEEMRRRIIRRYKESDRAAEQYEEETRGVESAIIRLRPDKIISWDFN